jgi:hypothetical protein
MFRHYVLVYCGLYLDNIACGSIDVSGKKKLGKL